MRASLPRHYRFSLGALLTVIGLLGATFAVARRVSFEHVGQSRHWTRFVPTHEHEVARTVRQWLLANGFQPVESPPDSVKPGDLFGRPLPQYYRGSYEAAPRLYVSVNPNWENDNHRLPNTSNILVHVTLSCRVRRWEMEAARGGLEQFVADFQELCDSFEALTRVTND